MKFNDRPYVMLNVATTVDGKTDTVARKGAAISSPFDLARVDRLRAESDAVMVGGRTLIGDDPRLTVKSAALRADRRARGLTENPIKVGIITNATLNLDSRFLIAGPARVMIFTTRQTSPSQVERLRERGAQVFVMGESRVDLMAMMAHLKQNRVDRLLVEGGGTLNMELLKAGFVDEISVYVAPLIFGGVTAPTFADGDGLARNQAIDLHLMSEEKDDSGGVLLRYRIEH